MREGVGRRGSATARFRAEASELVRLEAFVRSLAFLADGERDRLIIVSSEILDNIIAYSTRLRRRAIRMRVHKGAKLTLAFYFKSDNFSAFAVHGPDTEKRYFDVAKSRYRGLGLAMCRRLSSSMLFRPGPLSDSILVTF